MMQDSKSELAVGQLPTVINSVQVSQEPLKAEDLTSAFEEFSLLSNQLTNTYRTLESRVNHLTDELNQASTQRTAALEEKEEIANRLENILDFLPGGVIVIDAKGVVTDNNPVAEEMLGNDLKGSLWRDLIAKCFAPQRDDGHEVSTFDGRKISISIKSLEDHGQIILLTDQTETRHLQAQLSRHERLTSMGKMVSALAHQIRTPLSAAMLYAGHLKNESLPKEKYLPFIDKLSSRLQHMEQQVRDMLLFVKGDLTLNDTIRINDFEIKLREAAEPLLVQNKAECTWENNCVNAAFKCNVEVLISALMNVVENAIQAVHYQPQLAIHFFIDDGHLSISIADNGPGIDNDIIEKIGEAFLTSKPQGLGLGITVVRTVAAGHGGHFDIHNQRTGGAIATLRIPIIENSFTEYDTEHYGGLQKELNGELNEELNEKLNEELGEEELLQQLSQRQSVVKDSVDKKTVHRPSPLRH